MQEIFKHINAKSDINNAATSTQTEIVAVHTPKDDSKLQFPYQKSTRPSSLALSIDNNQLTNCVSECSARTSTLEEAPSDVPSTGNVKSQK